MPWRVVEEFRVYIELIVQREAAQAHSGQGQQPAPQAPWRR